MVRRKQQKQMRSWVGAVLAAFVLLGVVGWAQEGEQGGGGEVQEHIRRAAELIAEAQRAVEQVQSAGLPVEGLTSVLQQAEGLLEQARQALQAGDRRAALAFAQAASVLAELVVVKALTRLGPAGAEQAIATAQEKLTEAREHIARAIARADRLPPGERRERIHRLISTARDRLNEGEELLLRAQVALARREIAAAVEAARASKRYAEEALHHAQEALRLLRGPGR